MRNIINQKNIPIKFIQQVSVYYTKNDHKTYKHLIKNLTMSGTLTIKPIQGQLVRDTDTFTKMDPYCQVILGNQVVKGKVCHKGGKNPKWDDTIILKRNGEPVAFVELRDKDTISSDEIIGVCQLDLNTLSGTSSQWWPIFYKQKPAGEVLFEITYTPENAGTGVQPQEVQKPTETQQTVVSGDKSGQSASNDHPHINNKDAKGEFFVDIIEIF